MKAIRAIQSNEIFQKVDARQLGMTVMFYPKAEADAEIARLEMKLRAICPHKKFHEVSFEDGYPGGDIATYECEYCGYHFTGELPQ